MIRRINRLQKFGIFLEHIGDKDSSIQEFRERNLIYGWNYSGKTTLSRVFAQVENKVLAPEFADAHFRLERTDSSVLKSDDLRSAPRVRVFNRDFVDRNFSTEATAPSIFIIGKHNADLRQKLAYHTAKLEQIRLRLETLRKDKEDIERVVADIGTNEARRISQQLGDRRFNRTWLFQLLEQVRSDAQRLVLEDEQVASRLGTVFSRDVFAIVKPIQVELPDVASFAGQANQLLASTATNRAIDSLRASSAAEKWVREGMPLHEHAEHCLFCGNEVLPDRIELLRGHFSAAYEKLVADINGKISVLQKFVPQLELPHEKDLAPAVRSEYTQSKQLLVSWLAWVQGICDELVAALREKLASLETVASWSGDLSRASKGAIALLRSIGLLGETMW